MAAESKAPNLAMNLRIAFILIALAATASLSPAQDAAAPETPPQEPAAGSPAIAGSGQMSPEQLDAMRAKLNELTLERDVLTSEIAVAKERLNRELLDRQVALDRAKFEAEEAKQAAATAVAKRQAELESELDKVRRESELLAAQAAIAKSKAEKATNEAKIREIELKEQIGALEESIAKLESEQKAANYAAAGPVYLPEPLQGKTLIISDRRIELNGLISARTADGIADRINFFNNRNHELPIFIVIDDSPGGSVMAGYKILKAMEGSEAPVYVVVKSFAASMAACITTLADRSFAYPNAIILHHQLSAGSFGNLTQHREQVEDLNEWWRRLAKPVADKMGMDLEAFIKRMYEEDSSGDWKEFADEAQKLKWVDVIVDEIRETSLVTSPDYRKPTTSTTPAVPTRTFGEANAAPTAPGDAIDAKGQPFYQLPRLNPLDAWYLYDPAGYYRN